MPTRMSILGARIAFRSMVSITLPKSYFNAKLIVDLILFVSFSAKNWTTMRIDDLYLPLAWTIFVIWRWMKTLRCTWAPLNRRRCIGSFVLDFFMMIDWVVVFPSCSLLRFLFFFPLSFLVLFLLQLSLFFPEFESARCYKWHMSFLFSFPTNASQFTDLETTGVVEKVNELVRKKKRRMKDHEDRNIEAMMMMMMMMICPVMIKENKIRRKTKCAWMTGWGRMYRIQQDWVKTGRDIHMKSAYTKSDMLIHRDSSDGLYQCLWLWQRGKLRQVSSSPMEEANKMKKKSTHRKSFHVIIITVNIIDSSRILFLQPKPSNLFALEIYVSERWW